jgi:dihydrofolate synthase/folylpolyglutamate synthase
MVRAAGYRTGFYSSPHLERVEERVRIDGRPIASDRLAGLLERVVGLAERSLGHAPTYFEAMTVAAFLYFGEEQVDLAVMEVGMGGRLDATNTAEPVLSLVTDIALDHQEHLGSTLAAIAREKAGIFRRGRPALVWVSAPEAEDSLTAAADEVGADLESARTSVRVVAVDDRALDGQAIHLATPQGEYHLEIALLGFHQVRNLGLAVRAAERLRDQGWERLDAGAITRGAAACRWPGRLEVVTLQDGRRVIFDGAHNPAGVEVVTDFLERLGRPVDLLFGALADKDVGRMLPPLAALAGQVTVTRAPSPRAISPVALAELIPGRPAVVEPEPEAALTRALAASAGPLLVCGSLYLVGALREALRRLHGVPRAEEAI